MHTAKFFKIDQNNQSFYLTYLPAGVLTEISYSSVRGVDDEPGAVQRLLVERRIKDLKDFILSGGALPGSIILNWVKIENINFDESTNEMSFDVNSRLAQIIDGQHRVAGIKDAIKENKKIAELRIPVVIYNGLTTRECADIFIAINTEQKPAPKSLVYDLYGISSELSLDHAAARARDIAEELNSSMDSPYFGKIKFPGEKRRKGGIALSTAVSAIKPLVEENGAFDQINVSELQLQIKAIKNYFSAIQKEYDSEWDLPSNAFQYSAGFTAACEFLKLKIIPYCGSRKSFETDTIRESITLRQNGLIRQEEVAGKGGKEAVKDLYTKIDKAFLPKKSETGGMKF